MHRKQERYFSKQVRKQGLVYRSFSLKLVPSSGGMGTNYVAKTIPEESLSSSARAARFGQTGNAAGGGQSRINLEDNELRGKSEGGCAC